MTEGLRVHVREAREKAGLTQAELAAQMGVSRKTVNTVENGVFTPSTIVALKFARALGRPVEALFALDDSDPGGAG